MPKLQDTFLLIFALVAVVTIAAFAWRVLPRENGEPRPGAETSAASVIRHDDYAKGNAKAAAAKTIIEFGDFECPYCGKTDAQANALLAAHTDAKLVWKDCPLPNHPNAQKAAEAARCAGRQGKFWEYRDILFASESLNPGLYASAAAGLGLNANDFAECLESGAEEARVRSSFADCAASGVTELPSFFLEGKAYSGADALTGLSTALTSR